MKNYFYGSSSWATRSWLQCGKTANCSAPAAVRMCRAGIKAMAIYIKATSCNTVE